MKEKRHYTYKIVSHKKIQKKHKDRTNETFVFFLNCKNDLGLFCIDVTRETYYNNKDNEYIKFNDGFTLYELYKFAVNDNTKNNITNNVKDDTLRTVFREDLFTVLNVTTSITLIMCGIFIILNYKIFDE